MTVRRRHYLVAVVTLLLSIALGQIAKGWSDLEYYGVFAALILVVVVAGLPWVEMAPDGAFRRRPQA